MRARLVALASLALLAAGCGGKSSTSPPAATRGYAQGFTDFPSAASFAAIDHAKQVIARDGDLVVYHLDGGVPWQEEAAGAAYHPNFEAELAGKQAFRPAGHRLYLAITPISFLRDGLASHVGAATGEPLAAPWDTLAFDDTLVVRTYRQYCERMIQRFDPDWFAFAIEANLLAQNTPAKWPAFLRLADSVYASVKRAHPALPTFATIQLENFYEHMGTTGGAVTDLMRDCDVVAMSTYPISVTTDATSLPAGYFTNLGTLDAARTILDATLAQGRRLACKPLAVAETGWPAEPITAPFPVDVPATPETQAAYVRRLLGDMDRADFRFVNWFFTRDYDSLWVSTLQSQPNAPLYRLWRDHGLYDGDGRARIALNDWKASLARVRR